MFGKYRIGSLPALLFLRPLLLLCPVIPQAPAAPPRGETIFLEKCAMCHLPAGQGAPPAYPPLAGSDWLKGDRTRTIRVLCEGLEAPIKVNGQVYNNVMPAQMLEDADAAAVLTYVTQSWGNQAEPFTADEVAKARAGSKFPTFAALAKAAAFEPLPSAPQGWTLKETAPLPGFCTRLAGLGKGGPVYFMGERGIVYKLVENVVVPWIQPESYADTSESSVSTMGLALGPDQRLWIVGNQRVSKGYEVDMNRVTVWRSEPVIGDEPPVLKAWLKTEYPWGVGPYNHGVSHIAFGPDGMLYINSGSRTDGGETGTIDHIAKTGEVPITAALWKLDPKAEKPEIEVLARGIRNAYGFAWNDQGQLFTASNGPDADAPEEMDFIQPGKHYGFPYQFSNWPLLPAPYPHTPAVPDGLTFTFPVLNDGPAGGGGVAGGLGTFDPHSSPGGMVWCGAEYAEPLRNGFILTRFGNLLPTAKDSGFDVLHIAPRLDPKTGTWHAKVTTVLAPLGRPLDVLPDGHGGLYVLEYTRPTNFKSGVGWLPGRLLQLSPAAPK